MRVYHVGYKTQQYIANCAIGLYTEVMKCYYS